MDDDEDFFVADEDPDSVWAEFERAQKDVTAVPQRMTGCAGSGRRRRQIHRVAPEPALGEAVADPLALHGIDRTKFQPVEFCSRSRGGQWRHHQWDRHAGVFRYAGPCGERCAETRLCEEQWDGHSCRQMGPHEQHQCCCGEERGPAGG